MSDKFSGEKPDDIPQSEWDASIAFKNSVDVSSMSACEFVARAMMKAREEEREGCAQVAITFGPAHYAETHPGHQRVNVELEVAIAQAIRNRKGA